MHNFHTKVSNEIKAYSNINPTYKIIIITIAFSIITNINPAKIS